MRARPLAVSLLFGLIGGACNTSQQPTATSPVNAETGVSAPPEHDPSSPEPKPIDWSRFESTSLRNPNDGSLKGGVPLPLTSPGLRFNPARDPKGRFGTVEMVRGLVGAAARVRRELGGFPVTINDLSLEKGGPIAHHRSHQNGRDVDVLFYQLGPDGQPIESVGAFFDPAGAGVDFKDLADPSDDVPLSLDISRTWLFLQSLIEDQDARLQRILIAEHLRALLLEHARSLDIAPETIRRFEDATCQPNYPHDDHLHLRFFCAPDDISKGCRDSRPSYPWRRKELGNAKVRALPLAPTRAKAKSTIVTHEQAREAAGPMDAEVVRWLDRRKQWIDKPHPGRTYCP
jgi:penicillin-insensitive murein endopeptidase